MEDLNAQLQHALKSRHPLIFVHSPEEQRVIERLREMAGGEPLVTWACTTGFDNGSNVRVDHPADAIKKVLGENKPGFYVFKDLNDFIDDPVLVRVLRDAYQHLRNTPSIRLFIISPIFNLPETLRKNVYYLDARLPDANELSDLARDVTREYTRHELPAEIFNELALALRGMTLDEARHVLHSTLGTGKLARTRLLEEIRAAKKALTAGSGFLDYVPVEQNVSQLGGLSNFKDWLQVRSGVFTKHAVESGLPVPRGILITGVSGCGKSLCAKVAAKTWGVPLYRLDMNLVFADMFGNPEATFYKALQTIESMAPAVLWIDEIENGLGFSGDINTEQSHIFSAFLTWMQEKPPLIFVAATANRIESLPAEMIRKGRFDQVFFVDLPDKDERAELFAIHLHAQGADEKNFNMAKLVLETEDWSGAEIEQVINAARLRGHSDKRPFTTEDIIDQARHVVPLARTMSEQIKALRDWAWNRAAPASSGKATEFAVLDEAN